MPRRLCFLRPLLLSMLVFALGLPSPGAAIATATTSCNGGYVLWSSGGSRTLELSGSDSSITGAVRANGRLKLSGSQNQLGGPLEYVRGFSNSGSANRYPTPARVGSQPAPMRFSISAYRPGGTVAEAARSAGRYTVVYGDLDVGDTRVLDGLYYVTGDAKLGAGELRGSVTIVAEGIVDVGGSGQQLSAYTDGLLFFANQAEPGAAVLKVGGGQSMLSGALYAPGGTVELSGSGTRLAGPLIGDALLLSGSSLTLAGPCPEALQVQPPPYAPGELLVKLAHDDALNAVAHDYGLDPQPLGRFGTRPIYRLRILDGSDPPIKAAQLRSADGSSGDARVLYAEPNYNLQTPEARRGRTSWVVGQDAGAYVAQWAPNVIGLAGAHAVTRGAGVRVAILDTGVDPEHPALAGRLSGGFDFVDFDVDPREEGSYGINPGFGHGTHAAGLVAMAAPDATIIPVRVLDPNGEGNLWVLAEGLLYAVEYGPDGVRRNGDEAQVISLSLGTLRPTNLLADLIAAAACAEDDDDDDAEEDEERCRSNGGVVVIAAAGNGGDSTPQYPAAEAVAGLLAVGASTSADSTASFSTYGPWVQLAAPGEAIVSSVPGGSYGTWSGTSMAAPLTAGVAALLRASRPELSALEVAERLVDSGRAISGPIARRLDAAAALSVP